jgi:hypothetical protein
VGDRPLPRRQPEVPLRAARPGDRRPERAPGRPSRRPATTATTCPPWRHAVERRYFPYTHSWNPVAALHAACQCLLAEGLDQAYARHDAVARRP